MAEQRPTLYVLPGSHPSVTARLMLEHKGLDYRRVDLVHAAHKPVLRALRFEGSTVPALRLDGERVQGSRNIARRLDRLRPEPPLLPSDAGERERVEEAEQWGDEVLQPVPRRLSWWAMGRDPSNAHTYLEDSKIPMPTWLAKRSARPVIWAEAKINRADDEQARADLAALPSMIDRVDRYIADGVIGGDRPNAADFQIATSVRLLLTMEDLDELLAGRPAADHARRLVPVYPGRLAKGAIPTGWLGLYA